MKLHAAVLGVTDIAHAHNPHFNFPTDRQFPALGLRCLYHTSTETSWDIAVGFLQKISHFLDCIQKLDLYCLDDISLRIITEAAIIFPNVPHLVLGHPTQFIAPDPWVRKFLLTAGLFVRLMSALQRVSSVYAVTAGHPWRFHFTPHSIA